MTYTVCKGDNCDELNKKGEEIMRQGLIAELKLEIENRLRIFLESEGIELRVAANDNMTGNNPFIELEAIDDVVLPANKLLFEIKVVLGLLNKPWKNDALVKGIYYALHPHNLTLSELTVLLMSMHIEPVDAPDGETKRKRTVMRYIVEEC